MCMCVSDSTKLLCLTALGKRKEDVSGQKSAFKVGINSEMQWMVRPNPTLPYPNPSPLTAWRPSVCPCVCRCSTSPCRSWASTTSSSPRPTSWSARTHIQYIPYHTIT